MRTRKEQVADLTGVYEDAGVTGDSAKEAAADQVLEAEQRGYERARAECVADTRRLEWLLSLTHYGIPGFDPKVSGRSPSERKADLIRAIDAAMEVG